MNKHVPKNHVRPSPLKTSTAIALVCFALGSGFVGEGRASTSETAALLGAGINDSDRYGGAAAGPSTPTHLVRRDLLARPGMLEGGSSTPRTPLRSVRELLAGDYTGPQTFFDESTGSFSVSYLDSKTNTLQYITKEDASTAYEVSVNAARLMDPDKRKKIIKKMTATGKSFEEFESTIKENLWESCVTLQQYLSALREADQHNLKENVILRAEIERARQEYAEALSQALTTATQQITAAATQLTARDLEAGTVVRLPTKGWTTTHVFLVSLTSSLVSAVAATFGTIYYINSYK